MVELELELTVLPTRHLPASERLGLGCPGKWGRLVVSHNEAGVGPWNGTRVRGLTPLTKPGSGPASWFRTTSPSEQIRKGPLLWNSHCRAMGKEHRKSSWGPQGPTTSYSAKPMVDLAGSLEGVSESPLL